MSFGKRVKISFWTIEGVEIQWSTIIGRYHNICFLYMIRLMQEPLTQSMRLAWEVLWNRALVFSLWRSRISHTCCFYICILFLMFYLHSFSDFFLFALSDSTLMPLSSNFRLYDRYNNVQLWSKVGQLYMLNGSTCTYKNAIWFKYYIPWILRFNLFKPTNP